MNRILEDTDVIAVIKSFTDINYGDDETIGLLLAVGAELLDVSVDTMYDLIRQV